MKQGMWSYMHVQNLMNSLWDIRIFLGLVPKESHCIICMITFSWCSNFPWLWPFVLQPTHVALKLYNNITWNLVVISGHHPSTLCVCHIGMTFIHSMLFCQVLIVSVYCSVGWLVNTDRCLCYAFWYELIIFLMEINFMIGKLGSVTDFGGPGVACWPLVPKFAGSNPAEAVGFLGAKKSSARLPSEGK
jgi:hypothetical protein